MEGTLGIASIKSTLGKVQLIDAIKGIASIPPMQPLNGRISPIAKISDYEDWPYKIVYATNGICPDTLMQHLNRFYADHPDIPLTRRPNIIQVAGKYVIFRLVEGMLITSTTGDHDEDI